MDSSCNMLCHTYVICRLPIITVVLTERVSPGTGLEQYSSLGNKNYLLMQMCLADLFFTLTCKSCMTYVVLPPYQSKVVILCIQERRQKIY